MIKLVSRTIAPDTIGNQIETLTEKQIFANEFSDGYAAYYNDAIDGLRHSKAFEVYSFEYSGQDRLIHNSLTYRITKPLSKGEKTVLICERVSADV